jgi:hypothetical protein
VQLEVTELEPRLAPATAVDWYAGGVRWRGAWVFIDADRPDLVARVKSILAPVSAVVGVVYGRPPDPSRTIQVDLVPTAELQRHSTVGRIQGLAGELGGRAAIVDGELDLDWLAPVVAHEAGHALGLGHVPPDMRNVMTPATLPDSVGLYDWQTREVIARVNSLNTERP